MLFGKDKLNIKKKSLSQIGKHRVGAKQHGQTLSFSKKLIDSSGLQWICISFSNNTKRYRNCNQQDGGEYCINNEGITGFNFKSAAKQIKPSICLKQHRIITEIIRSGNQKRRKMSLAVVYFPLQVILYKQQLNVLKITVSRQTTLCNFGRSKIQM